MTPMPSGDPDSPRYAVLRALMEGDLPALRRHLDAGFDPAVPLGPQPSNTAIGWVLLNLNKTPATLGMLQVLVERGAPLTAAANGGMSPLRYVADGVKSDENVALTRWLLPHLPPEWKTLVAEGGKPLLAEAIRWGQWETAECLHAAGSANAVAEGTTTALHEAVQKGHPEWVGRLLACGADTAARDIDGFTPLHRACSRGSTHAALLVQMLLDAGADPALTWRLGNRFLTAEDMARDGHVLDALAAFEAYRIQAALPPSRVAKTGSPRL